jgi:NAD-dependent dihydropyrimidine dehydrogenase PreA subunit
MVGELDPGPYTEDELDRFEGFRYKMVNKLPTRDGEECQMCMICEDLCPTGAMKAEIGQAQGDKCIVCLSCVKNCPDDILKINDLSQTFKVKMEMDKETDETLKKKKSKIYL